ncbi:M20/M25/M40 family metallo-hydrolase [Paenalcaligenes niemegkensis]|uniref:M20/M25/M40 family metallo-hydrolase n=1 Tax=Paenalcaligenes niemegkensis TaxID=2895469 RepID=UPI001EE8AA43|nr:M20/M25/M40 family metallo-hydrolase [Paenalcaligenes niemegkensis]MCQ9618040.1 M20/M25/M40 family metallo-hydrolase [Paenalcaligenes niemegkensis]
MSPASLSLLEKLIAFDTVSRHTNLALIEFVRNYLTDLGLMPTLIYNEDRSKANLHVLIGPPVDGGVVLSGHTDVVPVDGQPWDTAPFSLSRNNNKLYGRGTCDMKGFLAVALAKVPAMLSAPLKRPIHLAFSYDEEIGCFGAPHLIKHLLEHEPKPHAIIVGEPTSMQAVIAHKGIAAIKTTVIGHEAHSSQVQRGASAVTIAARLVSFIDDLMQENQRQADPDSPFVPPYTTLHTGVIQGARPSILFRVSARLSGIFATYPETPHSLILIV